MIESLQTDCDDDHAPSLGCEARCDSLFADRIAAIGVASFDPVLREREDCRHEECGVAYRKDLTSAARRHYRAATELCNLATAGSQPSCMAVAGYLFGLSGELAVKELMRQSGMTPLPPSERRDDPFFAHFPYIKELLKDTASGRRAGELRRIAESASLFQNWNTEMRYAPTVDIQEGWVSAWRESAKTLLTQMDNP